MCTLCQRIKESQPTIQIHPHPVAEGVADLRRAELEVYLVGSPKTHVQILHKA